MRIFTYTHGICAQQIHNYYYLLLCIHDTDNCQSHIQNKLVSPSEFLESVKRLLNFLSMNFLIYDGIHDGTESLSDEKQHRPESQRKTLQMNSIMLRSILYLVKILMFYCLMVNTRSTNLSPNRHHPIGIP